MVARPGCVLRPASALSGKEQHRRALETLSPHTSSGVFGPAPRPPPCLVSHRVRTQLCSHEELTAWGPSVLPVAISNATLLVCTAPGRPRASSWALSPPTCSAQSAWVLPALPGSGLWLKHPAGGPDTRVGSRVSWKNGLRGAAGDIWANDPPLTAGRRWTPLAGLRVTDLRGASRRRLGAMSARHRHMLPLTKPSVCTAGCPLAVTLRTLGRKGSEQLRAGCGLLAGRGEQPVSRCLGPGHTLE